MSSDPLLCPSSTYLCVYMPCYHGRYICSLPFPRAVISLAAHPPQWRSPATSLGCPSENERSLHLDRNTGQPQTRPHARGGTDLFFSTRSSYTGDSDTLTSPSFAKPKGGRPHSHVFDSADPCTSAYVGAGGHFVFLEHLFGGCTRVGGRQVNPSSRQMLAYQLLRGGRRLIQTL